MKAFHVYILASRSRALYIGITSDLARRIFEHRQHLVLGHTAKYRITRLVYYETIEDAHAAICREKQLKGWRWDKKVALVQGGQPDLGGSGDGLV